MDLHTLDAGVHLVTTVVAGGIFASQVDDLQVDAQYFVRGLHRRSRASDSIALREALRTVPQKRIAILVPAWKEAGVIQQMLEHNVAALDYDGDKYDFFCGTYPNDLETQRKVDAAARVASNVHKIVLPHDGPTSKADCLNWVYQGVVLLEHRRGERFDILLMHDAEDLIHPLSLRLYSSLIPRYEFVQTPVFSLPIAHGKIVAATYIDEFAEHHLKDMLVREAIGGLVPSAGVGSAFDRDAFEEVATAHRQLPFNTESLTEDYEIGLKFRLAGRRVHFAVHRLPDLVEERVSGSRRPQYVATREYFPQGLYASVRQRSRWILGITLQTWAQIGWKGPLAVRYCLWRDRKALFTNALLLAAYALVAYSVVCATTAKLLGTTWSFASIAPAYSLLWWVLAFNLLVAVWRAWMKAYMVGHLYGWRHALLSAPRLVVANVIGIAATLRALGQYTSHRVSGKPLRWLKTAHEYPSFELLRVQPEPLLVGATDPSAARAELGLAGRDESSPTRESSS